MLLISHKLDVSKHYLQQRLEQIAAENALKPALPPRKLQSWEQRRLEVEQTAERERQRLLVEYAQCVYVIPAGGFVKIGVSNDTKVRWKSLRTANAIVEPPLYVSPKLLYATHVESAAHRILSPYCPHKGQAGREWFRCNRYFAVEVVKQLILEAATAP